MTVFFFAFAWFGRYTPIELDMTRPDSIKVEVKGEVKSPGIYELGWNGELSDLIEKAGGFTNEAAQDQVNLTKVLQDREVITIPEKAEEVTKHISINSASEEELQQIKGIGPGTARKIVEYRENTPFETLEDLMNIKGIGEKTFAKMKDFICL